MLPPNHEKASMVESQHSPKTVRENPRQGNKEGKSKLIEKEV